MRIIHHALIRPIGPPGRSPGERALPGYYMAIWLTGTKGLEASRYQWLGAGHLGDWLRIKAMLLWLIAQRPISLAGYVGVFSSVHFLEAACVRSGEGCKRTTQCNQHSAII